MKKSYKISFISEAAYGTTEPQYSNTFDTKEEAIEAIEKIRSALSVFGWAVDSADIIEIEK